MSEVTYTTSLPTGMSVVVLNNNDVVLSIGSNWDKYAAFMSATEKSISMVSLSDSANNDTSNDGACIVADVKTGIDEIRDFVLKGLALPQTHTIHIYMTWASEFLNISTQVDVLGPMDAPVIKSAVISIADTTKAIVEVWPNKKSSDLNELKRDDLSKVSITATSKKDTKAYQFDVNDTGMYDIPKLVFGETYKFFAVMTSKKSANKIVSAPNNLSLYIVDTSAFDAKYLSAPIKDDSVSLTVASFKILGELVAEKRPKFVALTYATVPADILDVSKYEPKEGEYAAVTAGSKFAVTYDENKKEISCEGGALPAITGMRGLTLKYKAAFLYENGAGSYCPLQSVSVDALSAIPAPASYAVAATAVTTGLQLVAYEYSIVKDDKSAQPKVIGKWACDGELIIAGSTTANSITLSAFNGIKGMGVDKIPIVTSRPPTIAFEHDKKESPYFRLMKRAVYAKVGDFSWAAFTETNKELARAKLVLSGSDLKIDGKQWLVATKANIKSEWVHKDAEFATVALAECSQPSVDIADVSGVAKATFTVSEVQSHLDFVAKSQFTDGVAGTLTHVVIKKNINGTTAETPVARDINGKLTTTITIERGSKNYYSVIARAYKSGNLIGASAELLLPNLHVVPGASRALNGSYTCDSGKIESGVLAHDDAGVGASFAITYKGTFSADQDVNDFAYDDLYSADYQMSGVQSLADGKWSDVAGALVARFSPKDAEGKAILKTACFRITGVAGLKTHRVLLARQYALISDATVKIKDVLPVYLEFIPTIRPSTPIITAKGSDLRVDVVFANGAADAAEVLAKDVSNDLWTQGSDGKMTLGTKDSTYAQDLSVAVPSGKFAYVAGARSYENPNATVGDMTLVDGRYVSSELTARVLVNIEKAIAPLASPGASTVYTAEVKAADATDASPARPESYITKFVCDAPTLVDAPLVNGIPTPASDVSAEVVVYYNEAGFDKDFSKTYPLKKDKDEKFSHSLDTNQLRIDLGLTAAKFMAANLKCVFTAFKEYSHAQGVSDLRRSNPVSVNYTPKMKPTLQASDFSVQKLAGQLKVTTEKLSQVQLGGNSPLKVKIIAKSPSYTVVSDNLDLESNAALSKLLDLQPDLYTVSVVIQKVEGVVGETTIVLGTYRPDAALDAAKNFAVTVGSATSSLVATWENLAANALGGWALSARRIYVSGSITNVKKYFVASGNATITADIRTAYKSTSALTETLSGLPIGQELTVELETIYTKSDESDLVVKSESKSTCGAAPIFQSFTLDAATNTVNALINQNGSKITNFWLFAKYDGAQGTIYFNVDVASLATMSNTANCLFKIAMPTTGAKPSGVMGILVNGFGAVTNGSPALTFGAPAGGSVQYNSATDGKVVISLVA